MKTCGEVLIETISNYGIDTAFGIAGVTTVPFYKNMDKVNIRHIAPRHEQGCVFMADGYARVTGKPAVCIIITGPGFYNALTGMVQAMQESSPMLVITATTTLRNIGMSTVDLHQSPDQAAMGKNSALKSFTIYDPRQLPSVLAQAFTVFRSQNPGPVHIQIPLDIIYSSAEGVPTSAWAISEKPIASIKAIESVVSELKNAKNPLIIVGGGAKDSSEEVKQLAEALDIPVMNTTNAKGILSWKHELSCNGSPSLRPYRKVIKEADVIFAIGTQFSQTDYDTVNIGPVEFDNKLIRLDINPDQCGNGIKPYISLIGDSKLTLVEINKHLVDVKLNKNGKTRAAALRSELHKDRYFNHEIQDFFTAVKSTSDDLIIVGDSNLPTHHAVWQLDMEKPRTYFHSASGFGTLGLATPASFGVKLAFPKKDVVAIIGDGSFQFTSPELLTGSQENIPSAIIVWNNEKYQEIKNYMIATDTLTIGVDPQTPHFVELAKSLRCNAVEVKNLEELKVELKKAYKQTKPSVILINEKDIVKNIAGTWYADAAKKLY